MNQVRSIVAAVGLALLAGCAAAPPPEPPPLRVPLPARDTAPGSWRPPRQAPPASAPARPHRFPKVVWSELPSGLEVATIPSKSLPVVHLRVVVGGGKAADGEKPGLSSITASLLEEGGAGSMSSRDLVTRVESLGAELSIDTGFDATVLGLAVTRDHLGEAMDLLGAVVTRPLMAPAELEKLKKRWSSRLADAARQSGAWAAQMVLFKDLFALPSEQHPYATFSPTAADLDKITLADCRAFHKKFYVPKNTFVVVAGDTTPEAARAAVAKAFAAYAGGDAPSISFTDPNRPEARKITIVDRPRSTQSDIFVAALGPERSDKRWAAAAVSNQILGGGVAGRLLLDLREERSLAHATRSGITELRHGPTLWSAYVGAETKKTGLALAALLEHLGRLATTAPTEAEVADAARYLIDSSAVKLDTLGAVADELVHHRVYGLPDDHGDSYGKELGEITAPLALKAASDHLLRGREIIVVAGDASILGPLLSPFGAVKVAR